MSTDKTEIKSIQDGFDQINRIARDLNEIFGLRVDSATFYWREIAEGIHVLVDGEFNVTRIG